MAIRVEINNINFIDDDHLISLIRSSFNESDMKLFELNYKIYIANKNNPEELKTLNHLLDKVRDTAN
jgi:accessory colonization factor AcfC